MEQRKCEECGAILNQYNPGNLCSPCQEKRIDKRFNDEEPNYTAEDVAFLMGLTSAESVKRLAREGELPPSIPHIRKWLWPKVVFDSWIQQGHPRIMTTEAQEAILIALVKGYPLPEGTLYGFDIDNLISNFKALGWMPDRKPKRK